MVDFKKVAETNIKADETLNTILSKRLDNFDQFEEVSKIDDLDVAKVIIKRLLTRLGNQ